MSKYPVARVAPFNSTDGTLFVFALTKAPQDFRVSLNEASSETAKQSSDVFTKVESDYRRDYRYPLIARSL